MIPGAVTHNTARLKQKNKPGAFSPLSKGVPQGLVLGPSLFVHNSSFNNHVQSQPAMLADKMLQWASRLS